jgi:hypothetical protein
MKNYRYIFLIFATLVYNSCGDKLDLNPIGAVSESNFYQSEDDAHAAVAAVYNSILAFHTDCGW